MALRPEAFSGGAEAPDGSEWELFGERHARNPRLLLTDGELEMVRLWRAYRPSPGRIAGMAAGYLPVVGHLPESGGVGEQAAIMLDAFDIMTQAETERMAGER